MSIRRILQSPRARRATAAGLVVLSLGGLALARTSFGSGAAPFEDDGGWVAGGRGSFSGPGAHGSIALSHGQLLAGRGQRFFAELRLRADESGDRAVERAPLSLVVVLDTSGSMMGEKIEDAKRSVLELIAGMHDDDEIALVRYDNDAELVQPLARVGDVRGRLAAQVRELDATGGTNIPAGLRAGLRALAHEHGGRVQRVVLVSDGLDQTRADAEALARDSAQGGVTISSLGIGLDFDEGYLASVARLGHGNFGFAEQAGSLAEFLRRELNETANTSIDSATARLRLPEGVRFVRAIGAEAREDDGELALEIGSLFAGDERRVVVELEGDLDRGASAAFDGEIGWRVVGGERASAKLARLEIGATNDASAVSAARDGRVLASCLSAVASERQLAAAEAFGRGDRNGADALIQENLRDLREAQAIAPAAAATALADQAQGYEQTGEAFAASEPGSAAGRAAAKRAAAGESATMARPTF